jgi:zinc resistance-associated protein
MKKMTVILGSLALVATMAVGAWAGPWGPGPGYGPGYGPGFGLSKEDVAKLDQKRAAFMKDTLALRQQIAVKNMELRTEQAQLNPDQAKIKALGDQIIELRSQIAKKANDAGLSRLGFGRGFGRGGYGRGHHMAWGPGTMGYGPGMMGYGPGGGYGPGACWR